MDTLHVFPSFSQKGTNFLPLRMKPFSNAYFEAFQQSFLSKVVLMFKVPEKQTKKFMSV